MATFEEFKINENTLYKKIYRDTLKDSISSYLDSQDRKTASVLENYISQVAYIYGEHLARDIVFSGEMFAKNITKKIERSLTCMKTTNQATGELEPKFYSIMELCKYPVDLLKYNAKNSEYTIQKAVEDAIQEVKPLIDEYYENHEQKNQQFNWDGYVKAYHNVLNKYIDQAVRGNEYYGLANSLKELNQIKKFATSDKKYDILDGIKKLYNKSTGFTNTATGRESTGTYKLDNNVIYNSLSITQMYLENILKSIPDGQEHANIKQQIDYIERVTDVMGFVNSEEGYDLVKFFLATDRNDMVAQFLKNMNSDWDIVAKLSNNQCKKIMQNVDHFKTSKAYLAIKLSLAQYVRENYEKYVSEKALKNPTLLASEMIKLSKYCDQNNVSQILKLGKGVPDTALRYILEDIQDDKTIDLVDILPVDLQRQIIQNMSNKQLSNNRVLFNSWKYSTDKFIAGTEIVDIQNNTIENFEDENSIPKTVAMNILWENVLGLNRINYYRKNKELSGELSNLIDEFESDGIYADWNDEEIAKNIWDGRTFEQELSKVENFYHKVMPKLSEETEMLKK